MHAEALALARHAEEMRDALDSKAAVVEERARRHERERLSLVSERSKIIEERAEAIRTERALKRQLEEGPNGHFATWPRGEGGNLNLNQTQAARQMSASARSGASAAWGGGGKTGMARTWAPGSSGNGSGVGQRNMSTRGGVQASPSVSPTTVGGGEEGSSLANVWEAQAKTRLFLQEHDLFLRTIRPVAEI